MSESYSTDSEVNSITPKKQKLLNSAEVADYVAAYLRKNPDFLLKYPDLLESLTPPKRNIGEGITDLQHSMITRLRDRVEQTEDLAQVMIDTSRENLATTQQIHYCVLKLLAAESFDELIAIINHELKPDLELDYIAICIENDQKSGETVRGIKQIPLMLIDHLMAGADQIKLESDIIADPHIYGEAFLLIQSQALVKMTIASDTPPALLVFGSREPERFAPDQATELLHFMSQVISELIRIWLTPPKPTDIFSYQTNS